MTLDRGSRDDTTARSPVSARFVLSSFSRGFSFLLQRRGLTLRAFASSFFSSSYPPPFLPSSERRQVGVRAAVNSPAPLSALMSLLLFALLNAIRAYSVSLPPLLGPRATTSSFRLPRANVVVHARTRSHTRARARARGPRSLPRLFRAHAAPQQVHVHARNTDVRVTRGIAPRGRRGHSNQPQTCIRTLLCNF